VALLFVVRSPHQCGLRGEILCGSFASLSVDLTPSSFSLCSFS
jgi:hypothetical protein